MNYEKTTCLLNVDLNENLNILYSFTLSILRLYILFMCFMYLFIFSLLLCIYENKKNINIYCIES